MAHNLQSPHAKRNRGPFMKTAARRLLAMIAVILMVGVLGFLTRQFGSMEWLVENETRMRRFVTEYPWQAWFLGFTIYTAFSLIPGTAGKSVVCGWLFGFWQAVLMVDIGLTIAAVGAFLAARFVFRDYVMNRFGKVVQKLNRALEKDGAFYLLMMRVACAFQSGQLLCRDDLDSRTYVFVDHSGWHDSRDDDFCICGNTDTNAGLDFRERHLANARSTTVWSACRDRTFSSVDPMGSQAFSRTGRATRHRDERVGVIRFLNLKAFRCCQSTPTCYGWFLAPSLH